MTYIPKVGDIVYDKWNKEVYRVSGEGLSWNTYTPLYGELRDGYRGTICLSRSYAAVHLEPDVFLTEVYKTHGKPI